MSQVRPHRRRDEAPRGDVGRRQEAPAAPARPAPTTPTHTPTDTPTLPRTDTPSFPSPRRHTNALFIISRTWLLAP